jgi:hypothetical protein
MASLSPIKDPRNFSSKWLALKTPLTPLASVEKKTLSGFDIRLASLKGPTKLKANRRKGSLLYSEVSSNKALALEGVSPLAPFVSQGGGWGVRSSRANSYLKNSPLSGLKKASLPSFFGVGFLPKTILMDHRQAILAEEGAASSVLLTDGSLLISSDINQGGSLLVKGPFFERKSENPNNKPQSQNAHADYSTFVRGWDEYLCWATGIGVGPSLCPNKGFSLSSKSQVAKRGIIFYI